MEGELITTMLSAWVPYIFYWLFWFILPGAIAAYFVYQDGRKNMPLALDIHPKWWALFCLIGGFWAVLAYWLMHHSTLVKNEA